MKPTNPPKSVFAVKTSISEPVPSIAAGATEEAVVPDQGIAATEEAVVPEQAVAPVAKKSPRNLDPEIKRLRDQHTANVAYLRAARESKLVLDTILNKKIPTLLLIHREQLLDALMATTSRSFPTGVAIDPGCETPTRCME